MPQKSLLEKTILVGVMELEKRKRKGKKGLRGDKPLEAKSGQRKAGPELDKGVLRIGLWKLLVISHYIQNLRKRDA